MSLSQQVTIASKNEQNHSEWVLPNTKRIKMLFSLFGLSLQSVYDKIKFISKKFKKVFLDASTTFFKIESSRKTFLLQTKKLSIDIILFETDYRVSHLKLEKVIWL